MFRVLFGLIMFVSIVRFVANGWVERFYIEPQVFFPYFGFEWVRPLGEMGMYGLFAVMALSALGILFGLYYRLSAVAFFLAFTYVELIDKTYYLNHYYFVSLVSLLMIALPAHRYFSLDARRNPDIVKSHVPRWTVGAVRLQLATVYIFAGLAKLNYAWLFEAMPLKIWLQGQTDLPLIGPLFDQVWVPYVFSWFGAIYDLFIVIFLLQRKTRWWAYTAVIAFHAMTGLLFNIGMFPYIMMLATLIFFSATFHERIINRISQLLGGNRGLLSTGKIAWPKWRKHLAYGFAGVFFAVQVGLAMRFVFYPGNLFWNEEGYRFSWRVMLVEKAGTAFFYVTDPKTGGSIEVDNDQFLTKTQEKQMSFQPDMILQYAHFLRDYYTDHEIRVGDQSHKISNPKVTAEVYVRMNNSGSRLFIDPEIDLAQIKDSWKHKNWIIPYAR